MHEILWSVAGFLCIVIFTLAMKSLRIYIFVSCVLVVLLFVGCFMRPLLCFCACLYERRTGLRLQIDRRRGTGAQFVGGRRRVRIAGSSARTRCPVSRVHPSSSYT